MLTDKLRSKLKKPIFAYLTLVGGFLIQMTLGSIYSYGNMAPFILDYMNNTNNHTKGTIDPGLLTWVFGLAVFGFGASMSFGAFLIQKIGVMATILTGSWVFNLGVFLTYFTIDSYILWVAITYGLIVGLGIGTAYGTLLSIPGQWFPECKGLVTGIIIAGFGFSTIVVDFFQSFYITRNLTEKNTTSDPIKLKTSFLVMGCFYACCQFIGALLIRIPKLKTEINNVSSIPIYTNVQEIERKPLEMLFEKNFWILWLTYLLNSYFIVSVLSLHKLYGQALSTSDNKAFFLTVTSAFGGLFNGVGRIIWGYLMDKVSYKKLMSILTLSMSLMIGTFCFMENIRDIHLKFTLYFVWVIILHFLLSASFSIYPVICTRCFGMKYSVVNYGILFTAYALAGIATSGAITPIFNNNVRIHMYTTAFLVGCGLSYLSFLINLMYEEKPSIIQLTNVSDNNNFN